MLGSSISVGSEGFIRRTIVQLAAFDGVEVLDVVGHVLADSRLLHSLSAWYSVNSAVGPKKLPIPLSSK